MKHEKSRELTRKQGLPRPLFWYALIFGIQLFQSCQYTLQDENQSETLPSDSIAYYTEMIAHHPDDNSYLVHRARLYFDRSSYGAALNDLKAALEIDSLQPEIHILKSRVEMDYFRSLEALETLRNAERLWPDLPIIKVHLARINLILRQYEEARQNANQALKIDPLSAQPYLILGMVAKENSDTSSAIKYFHQAVQNDADLVDGWIELAKIQMKKKPDEAATYFESALQVAPDDLHIWHAYAIYWQNRDSLDRAKKSYERMIAIDSNYSEAYYNEALILMDQDSFPRALPLWNQYIGLSQDNAKGYYYRGICFEMSENYHSALADYTTAKSFDPGLKSINSAIESMRNKTSRKPD